MGKKQIAQNTAFEAGKAAVGKKSATARCIADGGTAKPNFPEKPIICAAICTCNIKAGFSETGAKLKQMCVSKTLKLYDLAAGYKSTIKAEVPYDMSEKPPKPYMSVKEPRATGRRPGGSRIPDVVIVKNGSKPPKLENIELIVEIKFPPDVFSEEQKKAYEKIAGGEKDKVIVLSPSDCPCSEKKPQSAPKPYTLPVPVPSKKALKKAATSAAVGVGVVAALEAIGAALEAAGPLALLLAL